MEEWLWDNRSITSELYTILPIIVPDSKKSATERPLIMHIAAVTAVNRLHSLHRGSKNDGYGTDHRYYNDDRSLPH